MERRYAELVSRIGLKTVAEDIVTASQVHRLNATLNRRDPYPREGDRVPWGWHAIFFPGCTPTEQLVSDGTASDFEEKGETALPRRMYAGNRFSFHEPLRIGDRATKEVAIKSVERKQGRSGPLIFATYGLRVGGPRGLVLEDEQMLVFRDKEPGAADAASGPGEPAVLDATWKRAIKLDAVTLFRFSACTFNPHRIHYDLPYVTQVERYPGLVVQGPLTAVLLLELLRDKLKDRAFDLSGFTMRARAPLYAGRPISLLGEPAADGRSCELWAADESGRLAMQISATFR